MKRMQLFEFEDYSWCPGFLRECLTSYIVAFHRMLGTPQLMAPRIESMLKQYKTDQIIDLCSGGGGAMPDIIKVMRERGSVAAKVTMTDLYPNMTAAKHIKKLNDPSINYLTESIDASNIPEKLSGLRTMVSSFHHMPEPVARGILTDAFQKKQPIFIFEVTNNWPPRILWWVPLPFVAILVLLHTPFMRPLTWRQVLLTYVIPILPLMIALDGTASNPRTYNADDFQEPTANLKSSDYVWEIETIKKRFYPERMLCVRGMPA